MSLFFCFLAKWEFHYEVRGNKSLSKPLWHSERDFPYHHKKKEKERILLLTNIYWRNPGFNPSYSPTIKLSKTKKKPNYVQLKNFHDSMLPCLAFFPYNFFFFSFYWLKNIYNGFNGKHERWMGIQKTCRVKLFETIFLLINL